MKRQLMNRLGAPLVRDVLGQFYARHITCAQACATLGIAKTRLYALGGEFLREKAAGRATNWEPGLSGGDHAPRWPTEVTDFLRKALRHGYGYSFAASEAERLHGFATARSQVRQWAIREGVVAKEKPPRLPAHTRRWQRSSVGELWQMDATPHRWFGEDGPSLPLLDMLDDCSRLQVGCAVYRSENVRAYLHFLHDAFLRHGLPILVYVDQAGVFKGNLDRSVTRVHERLKFYGVSFVFANSPEAKGKVERIHQVWQDRLPAYFACNGLGPDSELELLNDHIGTLRGHRNTHEKHREIGMTPQDAWDRAIAEGRSKLRPVPRDAWWPYVWSTWNPVAVGRRGRVAFGAEDFPTQAQAGTKAIVCEHLDGTYSVIREKPDKAATPVVLFTNRSK
jgi:hypothetical protein